MADDADEFSLRDTQVEILYDDRVAVRHRITFS
jgi:hypothetical protein